MIKKAFSSKKEIKEFKEKYSSGEIESEVISNLLQPYHQDKFPEIRGYCDFWWPKDRNMFGPIGALQFDILHYAADALKESFGKHDFSFEGNRMYKNYVLDFDGLTIVAPAKREVVLPETKELREKLVKFENEFCQFVVDYIFTHYDELEDFKKESLEKLKVAGIIDSNNQIDFQYFEKTKQYKPKLK